MQNKIKNATYNQLQEYGIQILISDLDRDEKEYLYTLIDERLEYLDNGGAMVVYDDEVDFD